MGARLEDNESGELVKSGFPMLLMHGYHHRNAIQVMDEEVIMGPICNISCVSFVTTFSSGSKYACKVLKPYIGIAGRLFQCCNGSPQVCWSLSLEYTVKSPGARVMNIVEDRISMGYLPICTGAPRCTIPALPSYT